MCVPACERKIAEALSRRQFFKRAGSSVLAVTTGSMMVKAQTTVLDIAASQIVDLTHTLGEGMPTFSGEPQFEREVLSSLTTDGFNVNRWHLHEHTGTHLDAPLHFSELSSAADIPLSQLLGPLAIIDIKAKAAQNADAEVSVEDIKAWESNFGDLPAGAIVAMNSGWDARIGSSESFRNVDAQGIMHFPGFHIEACQYLLEKEVKGIMVDTLSLDYGKSSDFAVHFSWLPANRWGIENVANLDALPLSGATVIVGAPKIEGASGGTSRVMALV